jgi:predicted ATPase/DNA-binding SARP family transcriptional activator
MHDRSRAVLALTLLGPPVVSGAGTVLPIPRRQTRALLYRLATELVPIPRSQLGFLFWPDVPEYAMRRNLTHLLTLVRQVLPQPTVLITDATTVALNPELVWSDTATFMHLTRTSAAPDRPAALAAALDLSRGPLLDGFALAGCPEFEAWLDAERHVWERRIDDTLATMIETHTVVRNYGAAIALARRALARDPLAEELHRRLIALYAATGDRTSALRQFEQCVVVLERELGVSPLPETRTVYESVRAGGSPLPPAQSAHAGDAARTIIQTPTSGFAPSVEREILLAEAHGLLTPLTPLIGRTVVLAEVLALLASEVRLLTLAGPGGAGKTRLALEVARALHAQFADGVAFVPLAPLRDAALVPQAIVEALGLGERDDRPPLLRLKDLLRERKLLLVLDNCEHVLDAAPALAEVLAVAPGVTILTTSRELLRIAGEQTYYVPPLELPDLTRPMPPAELVRVGAVALFLARVRERTPGFALTEANASDVAAICTRLDGLPLAIELAAARAALLSPRMLRARLDRRLTLLTDGPRDLPERQRTLRATIDWSYALLDRSEQLLLGRLAAFAGGWTLTSAEQVSATVGSLAVSVLDGMHALLNKSLIQRTAASDGEPRFSMLETIREYALERLAERGEAELAQQAHASYFVELAEQAELYLHGPDQIAWFDRLDQEHANVRVALAWLLEGGAVASMLRIGGAIHWFWYVRGYLTEGRRWLGQALVQVSFQGAGTIEVAPKALAHAHFCAGHLATFQGDYLVARTQLETSIALCRELDRDEVGILLTEALTFLIVTCAWQGDYIIVNTAVAEYDQLVRDLNQPWSNARSAFNHGRTQLNQFGNAAAAQPLIQEAQSLFQGLGDVWHLTQVRVDLAVIALIVGDAQMAHRYCLEALDTARALRDRAIEAHILNNLGEVARLYGDDPRAEMHYVESLRIYRVIGSGPEIPRLIHNLGYLALHTNDTRLARERFVQSLQAYHSMQQQRGLAEPIAGLACIAAVTGTAVAAARAATLWGAATALATAAHSPIWPTDRAERACYEPLARARLGDAAFSVAYAAGALLTLDEAVAEALRV